MPSIEIVTEVPGPNGRVLVARRKAAISAGSTHLTDAEVLDALTPAGRSAA